MSGVLWLVPVALVMGLAGLAAFMWSLGAAQYDDPLACGCHLRQSHPVCDCRSCTRLLGIVFLRVIRDNSEINSLFVFVV